MYSSKTSVKSKTLNASSAHNVDALANKSITPLFLSLAIPMAIGMLINGAYNLVDAYFVTQYVGEIAFSAVSTIFPVNMLLIALSVMISNGTSVLLSQYYGKGDKNKGMQVVGVGILLSLVASVIVLTFMITFQDLLLNILGVTDKTKLDAQAYFVPLVTASVTIFSLSLASDFLRSMNRMGSLLTVILVGAFSNIVLDALFIVVLQLGVSGAITASIFSQSLAVLVAWYFLTKKTPLTASFAMRLSEAVEFAKRILELGFPVFISYFGAVVVIAMVNATLTGSSANQGELDIAAYGILSRVNVFIILPLIAMANAGQTIIAYNFGASHRIRVKRTFSLSLMFAAAYLTVMAAIALSFPTALFSLFSDDRSLISHGISIVNYLFIGMPIAGVGFVSIAALQALGEARLALFLSCFKVYFVLLPLMGFSVNRWGVDSMWYAFPIAEGVAFLFVVAMLAFQLPKLLSNIKPSHNPTSRSTGALS